MYLLFGDTRIHSIQDGFHNHPCRNAVRLLPAGRSVVRIGAPKSPSANTRILCGNQHHLRSYAYEYFAPSGALGLFSTAHKSPLWIAGLVWHGIIWFSCVVLKRRPDCGWLAALLPAPVLLLCLTGAALIIRSSTPVLETSPLAVFVAISWSAAISAVVFWVRREPGFTDHTYAVDFAGMTNVTALLLIPLTGLEQVF